MRYYGLSSGASLEFAFAARPGAAAAAATETARLDTGLDSPSNGLRRAERVLRARKPRHAQRMPGRRLERLVRAQTRPRTKSERQPKRQWDGKDIEKARLNRHQGKSPWYSEGR
jgi:hypothetical protein